MTAEPLDGAAAVVAGVVAAELSRTGLVGVALASPPSPEARLLSRWLARLGPVRAPDPGAVADLAGALAAAGAPARQVEDMAWRTAAEALAAAEGLLPLGATNKTQLLLDPDPLPARVLPLGDVWASAVWALEGSASLPPVLGGAAPGTVAAVEAALDAYLEGGARLEEALASLGAAGEAVGPALDGAEWRRRGLLVPKLARWTAGTDLAR